jgi:nucleotide-binding universal stress UspA family protein
MQVLIYAGLAPSRDLVLRFSTQIVQRLATAVTLVSGGGARRQGLLEKAVETLQVPPGVPLTLRALEGDAQTAILEAASERSYDLAIFGRLHQPIARLLPGSHSKAIAQRLEPSVLRVHGVVRPIRRILLASGGDRHTLVNAGVAARIAAGLGAAVTITHVVSQQALVFSDFPVHRISVQDFLEGDTPEAAVLREAATILNKQGVPVQVKGRVGPVLDEIMAELRVGGYDLLVIGAHRVASALDRILLEDITGDLLDISPLPVLVVKDVPGDRSPGPSAY